VITVNRSAGMITLARLVRMALTVTFVSQIVI
jgi:hypothetical protein